MSREILRGTSEAALGLAESYEEYLVQRAKRLTGENSSTPVSLGDIAINLLIAGTLAPTPGLINWGQEVTPVGEPLEMLGEGAARRAELILEVAGSLEGQGEEPQRRKTK